MRHALISGRYGLGLSAMVFGSTLAVAPVWAQNQPNTYGQQPQMGEQQSTTQGHLTEEPQYGGQYAGAQVRVQEPGEQAEANENQQMQPGQAPRQFGQASQGTQHPSYGEANAANRQYGRANQQPGASAQMNQPNQQAYAANQHGPGETCAECVRCAGMQGQAMQEMHKQAMPSRPTQRDQMIADRVALLLAASPSLEGLSITVTANQRAITLDGTVPDNNAKQRATVIAQRTRGVRSVTDNLDVRASDNPPRHVSDQQLAKDVAQKLARTTFPQANAAQQSPFDWRVDGPNWQFDVDADQGTISLNGSVDNYADVQRAVQSARQVAGARSVNGSALHVNDMHGFTGFRYGPYAYSPYE